MNPSRDIFVTGGTGYIGSRLIPALLARGHSVRALMRPAAERKLPSGCIHVSGDALEASTFRDAVAGCDTFVQLVGVAHPGPGKKALFRTIDLRSALAGIEAAAHGGVAHFIYVSVAQPAPVMREYVAVRAEAEAELARRFERCTVLRPWYVIGPGHRWPIVMRPVYSLFERFPPTRDAARRLGLVTIDQMLEALVHACEHPPERFRIVEVPGIRSGPPE